MDSHMKVLHINIIPDGEPAVKRRKRSKYRTDDVVHAGKLVNLSPCEICHKLLLETEREAHMNVYHQRPEVLCMYPCEVCRKPFDRRMEKQAHFRESHPTTPLHFCSGCRSTFVEKEEFDCHTCANLPQLSYVCGACGVRFSTPLGFEQHSKKAHKVLLKSSEHPDDVARSTLAALVGTASGTVQNNEGSRLEDLGMVEEQAVVMKKIGRRFVILKMPSKNVDGETQRIRSKRPVRRDRKVKSFWPYPDSPLPPVEPLRPEDFDSSSTVKIVSHRRSVFRINSMLQVSAPDVIEMLQPSGNLLKDEEYTNPDADELILDESSGFLVANDGRRLVVEPDEADFRPFVDEEAGREYYKLIYEQFQKREDCSALPVIIGSSAEVEQQSPCMSVQSNNPSECPSTSSLENSPRRPPKLQILKKGSDQVSKRRGILNFVSPESDFTRLEQENEMQNRYVINNQDDFEISNEAPSVYYEEASLSADGELEDDNVVVDSEQDDRADLEISDGEGQEMVVVQEDELGLQVFSDEEGRLIIVQPNGVTSVAPPGSQVVQIDTGEIFILQPTEDGNTIAVPLASDETKMTDQIQDQKNDGVAVWKGDGSMTIVNIGESGQVEQTRTIQSM